MAPQQAEQIIGTLTVAVTAGERGPVMFLSGEADYQAGPGLTELLLAQVDTGADHVTANLSALTFADSSSLRAFLVAARALRERGGSLELLYPQRPVARALRVLGADQIMTVRGSNLEPNA